ncbi:MAG: hypothetical protein ACI8RD_012438, partial [Bacillariaceae sp.]
FSPIGGLLHLMDECRVSVLNWRIHDRIDFYVRFGKKKWFSR